MHTGGPVRHKRGVRLIARIGWQLILPASLLVLWWLWSERSGSIYFPPLSKILVTFKDEWLGSGFLQEAIPSLRNLVIGYSVGVFLGVIVGVVVGLIMPIQSVLSPLIEFGRAMPPPAVLPFAILVFGIGSTMTIGIISFGIVFVVLLNTIDGVRSIDPTMQEMAKAYRFRRRDRLTALIMPAASPSIVAGMRTALSLGLLMMIVSEMAASTRGIGFYTLQAEENFNYRDMWAGMILLAIIGYILNLLFDRFERRVLFWQVRTSGTRMTRGVNRKNES